MNSAGEMLRRLAGWWWQRSKAALPGWLVADGPEPARWHWDGTTLTPPTPVPRRKGPWRLVLGDVRPLVLERELPVGAAAHLRRVVGMQLGHWTPLSADAALYDAQVAGPAANAGQLRVRVALLARSRLTPALTAATAQGLPPPEGVALADGSLLPLGEPKGARVPPRLLLLALLLLAPPLSLAVLHEGRLSQLRTELEAGEMEAAQARSLGIRLARLRADTLAAVSARRAAPSMVVLLDRLSRLLPDNSYLTELRLEGGRVHLLGYSGDGAGLPALLAAAPGLQDVRFEAALLRADAGRDRFHLSFMVSADEPA